jgi:hypothetical protein
METREIIGAGVLVAGLATSVAMSQNQIQISSSGRTIPPVTQGTVSDAGTAGTTIAGRVGFVETERLTLNRLVDGSYVAGFMLQNQNCVTEKVSLAPFLLGRNNEWLPLTGSRAVDGATQSAVDMPWEMPAATFHHVTLTLNAKPSGKESEARKTSSPPSAIRQLLGERTFSVLGRIAHTVWAALLSTPMHYGHWSGLLPANGSVVLTLEAINAQAKVDSDAATSPGDATCKTNGFQRTSIKRPLVLQPPLPSGVDTGVLFGSAVLALLATLAAGIVIFGSTNIFLAGRMGDVDFDFRNSWGANVTIGVGVLTGLTSGTLLPQDQYSSSSSTYLLLAALFAALVPLGTAVYGLIRPPVTVKSADPAIPDTIQPQGYAGVYLLSSAIVLWGAFGQLLLLGMLLREFVLARALSDEAGELLILATKGLGLILLLYAVLNAINTVKGSSEKSPAGAQTARPRTTMI